MIRSSITRMRRLFAGLCALALALPLSTHAQCVTPPAGLVSWWRAEGNALDEAGTNAGTLAGNATFGPGMAGQAFALDGAGDGVNVGTGTNLWLQNFSIEAWVKRASPSILSFDGNGGAEIFAVGTLYGGFGFYFDPSGQPCLGQLGIPGAGAGTLITNTLWHHLAVTKQGTTVVFYVDGMAFPAANALNAQFTFGAPAFIGAWTHDGLVDNSFYGSIDELAVYNRALSTNEVRAIYQADSAGKCTTASPPDCAPPPSGLAAWWQAEGNANDIASTNNGVLINGATFAPGKVGQAFSFNGTNSYVNVADSPSLRLTSELTIEFWVKRQRLDAVDYVVEKGGDWTGNAANYAVALHTSTYNYCLHFVFAGGWRGGGSIADLNWHHCAVVARQGDTNPTFYIDGVQQPSIYGQGASTINLYPSTRSLHIGALLDPATGYYYYSKTFVDEMSLYNRALSASEISAIYSAGAGGKCPLAAPPTITVPPTNQAVVAGAPTSLAVTATGTPPLAYQWLFNEAPLSDGGPITGSTSSVLIFSAVRTNDAGSYRVVVSNAFGMVTSSVATLTVVLPPVITAQPQDRTVSAGSNATFTVQATGTDPLGYQWFFNGGMLANDSRHSGVDTPTLTLSNAQLADAGSYSVTVSNIAGSLTSTSALLTVLAPPAFLSQPLGCSVLPGMPASFSATVWGTTPLSCQWQLNGQDIPNATNTTLSIAAVAPTDFGRYQLVVSNSVGVAISDSALLTWGPVAAWGNNSYGESLVPPGLSNVTMLAAGDYHSLALRIDGTVIGWGYDNYGQTDVPPGLTNVLAVAAGTYHSLALLADGTVIGWGYNNYGQTNTPAGLSNVVAIAAGAYHSLALRADGSIVAWGQSVYNQASLPGSLYNIVGIAAGSSLSLALRADGTVVAWGLNTFGQTNTPVGLSNVVAIAAGAAHSLALRADGSVVAWGMNSYGQTNVPADLTNAIAIAAGDYHNLALRADGTVVAWGQNTYGQTNSFAALTNLVAIAAGGYHNLALQGDGRPLLTRQPASVTSWTGRGLALRAAAAGAAPLSFQWQKDGVSIPDATNATLVFPALALTDQGSYQLLVTNPLGAAASFPATLTVLDGVAPFFLSRLPFAQTNYLGSTVILGFSLGGSGPFQYQWRCQGQNIPGATREQLVFDPIQLTNTGAYSLWVTNQFGILSSPPTTVNVAQVKAWGYMSGEAPASATNLIAVASSYYNYIALRPDGRVIGWSSGVGPGPVTVPSSLSNVVAIAAGYDHYASLRSDGSVFVWGSNTYGQSNVPPTASGVVAIAAGYYHDLALRADGTVVAWGQSTYGQTAVPTNLTGVVALAAGSMHSLALKADGTVVGWGQYSSYQPIPPSATNLIAIAAGGYHCLALRADGTVIGWGQSSSGASLVPPGLSNVVAIAAGAYHSVALRSDGTVVTWGSSDGAVPLPDVAYAIQIAAGGNHGLTLFGNRSPAVTIQPFSRTLFRGANTILAAKAAGAQPAAYQWRFKGADIPGATTDTLALTNLQLSQAGAYQLAVSNAYGLTTSLKAKLMVTLPLGEALDAANFTWTTSGNAQWYGQADTTSDGIDAARSGAINDGQETILQTTITGPGQLFWFWKVSSEPTFDQLEFRLNGVSQLAISGEVDWEQRSFSIPAGPQTVQWRYSKDPTFNDGQDAAWVDQVAFVRPPVITVPPFSQTVSMGAQVLLSVTASGMPPLAYQWLDNGTPLDGATNSTLSFTNATRSHSGTYAVRVSNAGGSVLSSSAVVKVLVPQNLSGPSLQPDGSFVLTSGDADGGLLTPADLPSFEVRVSTNLVFWETLPGALTLTNGLLQLQDTNASNFPMRFYRIYER